MVFSLMEEALSRPAPDSRHLGGLWGCWYEFSLVLRCWESGDGALRGRMVYWCEPVSAQGQDRFGGYGSADRGQGGTACAGL